MPSTPTDGRPTGRHRVVNLCSHVARHLGLKLWMLAAICLLIAPSQAAQIIEVSRARDLALIFFPPPNPASVSRAPEIWSLDPLKSKCALHGNFRGWAQDYNGAGSAAFSSDGRLVALGFGDGATEIYQTENGRLWARLGTRQAAPLGESEDYYRVGALAFSPDGKSLASSNVKGVFLWELRTRKLRFSRSIVARVKNLTADADGRFASRLRPATPSRLCFSPDGKTLAMAGSGGFPAFLFDVAAGRVRHVLSLNAGEGGASEILFSPDGSRVLCVGVWAASGGSYDKMELFDARSGRALWRWSAVKAYDKGEFSIASSFTRAAFSANGQRFAVGNGWRLEIRSARTGRLLSRQSGKDAEHPALQQQKRLLPALAVR